MRTSLEKAQKEIETKEVLKIPYDSNEIMSIFAAEAVKLELVAKLIPDNRGNFGYRYSYNSNTDVSSYDDRNIFKLLNKIEENFFLSAGYDYSKLGELETFNLTTRFNNSKDTYSGTYNSKTELSIYGCICEYIKSQSHLPNEIRFTLEATRNTNENFRKAWYRRQNSNEAPEATMARLFSPTVRTNGISGKELRSRYRNPFSRGSIKARLYMMCKEELLFCIEYLYGKKLNFSMPCHEIYKVLIGLPNSRFNINDIVKAKELYAALTGYSVKNIYDSLKKLGIEPATDLSRWVKRRNLDLTVQD